ncbi:TonB-dependent receptor [Steroidobacter sp. S1-65]|uniref:TonB-dependent receptor n=1 Tax=Steroidobacter gossypii TaxID=2805490 RepID=A0ABS1WWM0_9GAMM|nr:TonB-dependent receptor [Steroidobacter gossypii]MBM0105376.1 TonB-dependent receptor [Steroidobacter gossypii]
MPRGDSRGIPAVVSAVGVLLSCSAIAEPQQSSSSTAAPPVEEVVVTGYRGSLAVALEEKREQSGVVDVIKAEDVAKFPDANLAESLQRLPGVVVARDGGEGRSISVRGLGPDYTRVRLNGLEAQTTSNGFEGINRTRGFDFNVFASELFNSLTVRKTPSAATEEGSLGATVDLQTARPFDKTGTQFAFSSKVSYNDLSEKTDPRFALLASNTFFEDTVGVLVSAAYSKSRKISQASHNLNWDRMTENGGWCDPANPAGVCYGEYPEGISYEQLRSASIYHPRIPRLAQFAVDNERLGVTSAIQWRPAAGTEVTLDLLYSRHEGLRQESLLTPIGLFRGQSQQGKPETIVREAEIRGNDLIYARLDNVDLRAENSIFDFNTVFKQAGLTIDQELSERWRASLQLGASDSDFDEPRETTLQVDRLNTDGFIYDFRQSQTRPRIVWGFDTTDPANYYYGPAQPGFTGGSTGPEIRLRPQAVENTFRQGALDVEFDLSRSWKLKTGVNVRKYTFDSDSRRMANERSIPALPAGVTVADLVGQFSGFVGFGVPSDTATAWVLPSEQAFIDIFDIYSNTGVFELRRDVASARSNIYSVDEKDTAAYVQGDFNAELLGLPVRGDVGVRFVRTDQDSVGFAEAGVNTQLLRVSRSYDDWLPAANLALELRDDVVARFAVSRVMTRPPLAQLTPGGSVNVFGGTRQVNQGNPNLDPIEADAFDAGIEWYFAPESVVSLGFFYKDVKTYIATLRTTQPFNTLGIPEAVLIGTGVTPTDDFVYSRPVNSDGGPLRGVELNVQMPLSFLPGWLQNFGVLANYTRVSSDITYVVDPSVPVGAPGRTAVLPLINLSEESANATLYYGAGGFEARVSASYRDDYLRIVPGLNGQDADATEGSVYLDASLSYSFGEHYQVSLEGQNLGDTYEHLYNDTRAERNEYYRNFGRQYTAGFRYSF